MQSKRHEKKSTGVPSREGSDGRWMGALIAQMYKVGAVLNRGRDGRNRVPHLRKRSTNERMGWNGDGARLWRGLATDEMNRRFFRLIR